MLFFGSSEVNSTWLITSELANQRTRKVLFTCVVYTNYHYMHGQVLCGKRLCFSYHLCFPVQLCGKYILQQQQNSEQQNLLLRNKNMFLPQVKNCFLDTNFVSKMYVLRLRWRNTVFAHTLPDAIQHAHKYCKNQTCRQYSNQFICSMLYYLYYFSS